MFYKVFYTDHIVPSKFAGITIGPFIFIRPKYVSDVGLLEHEKVHVQQFWRNPFYGIPYLLSKKARLRYEVEAYKVQMKYCTTDKSEWFASRLVLKYNLGITYAEALAALKE